MSGKGASTMSPSTQQWTRRIRYSEQNLRVSDADRNAVAELLTQHYAEGRLDQAEFDDRVDRTMAAKTRGDLAGLFDDLPDTESAGTGPGGPARAVPYRTRGRRGGILRPLLLVALVLICASVAWHALTSVLFGGAVVWLLVAGVVIVLLARSRRL
jgi:hypothetical protein